MEWIKPKPRWKSISNANSSMMLSIWNNNKADDLRMRRVQWCATLDALSGAVAVATVVVCDDEEEIYTHTHTHHRLCANFHCSIQLNTFQKKREERKNGKEKHFEKCAYRFMINSQLLRGRHIDKAKCSDSHANEIVQNLKCAKWIECSIDSLGWRSHGFGMV